MNVAKKFTATIDAIRNRIDGAWGSPLGAVLLLKS